jgi:hypothetical protein
MIEFINANGDLLIAIALFWALTDGVVLWEKNDCGYKTRRFFRAYKHK